MISKFTIYEFKNKHLQSNLLIYLDKTKIISDRNILFSALIRKYEY